MERFINKKFLLKSMKVKAIYLLPATILGVALAIPIKNETVDRYSFVVKNVKHSDWGVDYGVKKVIEGKADFIWEGRDYENWPQLKELDEDDLLTEETIRGKSLAGLTLESIIGKRIPILEFPKKQKLTLQKN